MSSMRPGPIQHWRPFRCFRHCSSSLRSMPQRRSRGSTLSCSFVDMPRRPRRSQKQTRQPPASGTTADALYEALRQRIVEGEFAPGQRLRSDALATMLKVSRTPVREALRKLEAEGLIGHSPRGALIVNQLSEDDLTEIFQIREALEGLAARLAADNATPSEITELQALIEDMQSAVS